MEQRITGPCAIYGLDARNPGPTPIRIKLVRDNGNVLLDLFVPPYQGWQPAPPRSWNGRLNVEELLRMIDDEQGRMFWEATPDCTIAIPEGRYVQVECDQPDITIHVATMSLATSHN